MLRLAELLLCILLEPYSIKNVEQAGEREHSTERKHTAISCLTKNITFTTFKGKSTVFQNLQTDTHLC